MPRRFLSEHDHDVYEMELAEQRLLDALNAQIPCEESEGYPPDLDEWQGPRSDCDPTDRYGVEADMWGRR